MKIEKVILKDNFQRARFNENSNKTEINDAKLVF